MYSPVYTRQFEKDIKKISKSGSRFIPLLKTIIEKLTAGETLEPKYKNHHLYNSWKNHFECHVKSDFLLIYKIDDEKNEIYFVRAGSHAELFK